jgi:hypothetical protein
LPLPVMNGHPIASDRTMVAPAARRSSRMGLTFSRLSSRHGASISVAPRHSQIWPPLMNWLPWIVSALTIG